MSPHFKGKKVGRIHRYSTFSLSLSLPLSQKENWRKRKNLSTPFPKEKEVEGRKSKETCSCTPKERKVEVKKTINLALKIT